MLIDWQVLSRLAELDPAVLSDLNPATIAILIVIATFITEDGACIAAGALAAEGVIGLPLALGACFAGIVIGDMGLYGIGRAFAGTAGRSRILSALISRAALERASNWLERRGAAAIFISRFVTGLRLPTYLAAGFLRTSFPRFAFYFLVAAALWTPLIVIFSSFAQQYLFTGRFLLGIVILFLAVKAIHILVSRKRRRYFLGALKRLVRWEFWPLQVFYAPVVAYCVLLSLRHRSITVFTCANPAIPAGGFVGESKHEIYEGLNGSAAAREHLPKHFLLEDMSPEKAFGNISGRIGSGSFEFPLVLKPDVGERGKDVAIVRDAEELREALEAAEFPLIVQEFARGEEFSIFYYRYPLEEGGRIFSVTEKLFPFVVGDGVRTIEELVLDDERAVCIARKYLDQLKDDPERVPEDGEIIRLIEIGTHSRGAIFNDGGHIATPELEARIDEICKGFEGFYFGRFDIRTPSAEAIAAGREFAIVELNGVTSESTNIYDRKYSLLDAYRILCDQWRIAYEIGSANRDLGTEPAALRDLVRMFFRRRGS